MLELLIIPGLYMLFWARRLSKRDAARAAESAAKAAESVVTSQAYLNSAAFLVLGKSANR